MDTTLKPDVRSEMLMITPDKLRREIEEIKLNDKVPEFIRQRFEVIKKLILHSYYVYEFLDVAFDYSFLSIEGALGEIYMKEHNYEVEMIKKDQIIKVKTFTSLSDRYYKGKYRVEENKNFRPSLNGLIHWYEKKHDVILDESVVEPLKFFRNNVAHPHDIRVMGIQNVSTIKKNCKFINSLFL